MTIPPWYKQFWPWVLIGLPASAVIGSLFTVILALWEPDGLVVDDYYKQGLAVNQDMARQRDAEARGLRAAFTINIQDGIAQLSLNEAAGVVRQLKLRLVHPTRASKDRKGVLNLDMHGHLSGLIDPPETGRWQVVVEPQDGSWRLSGQLHIPEQSQITLSPG